MLVLARKIGESIVIDGGITVTIIKLKGNVVQLGINAPEDISIRRTEICEPSSGLATSVAGGW